MERRSREPGVAHRGYVAILLIAVIGMATSAWFVTSLSASAVRHDGERKTAAALALAKQALIGRAAIDISQPGSLPCPDLVTHIAGSNMPDDGIADLFAGTHCPNYVGRLPWRTLDLPDLRDAGGERLWYALSPNFRDYASLVRINDTTVGTLSLSGATPVNNIAAIIFSPGPALGNQLRTNSANHNNVAHYLDGANALGGPAYVSANADDNFNDRLVSITVSDLIAAVEKRIAFELTKALNTYYMANSLLPTPALTTDATCLPGGDVTLCLPSGSNAPGLLPRNVSPGAGWHGVTFPAWFNSSWRTSVSYTVAAECTSLPACSSSAFSAMTDAGIFTPKVTLVVGSARRFTVRAIAP
jgi:hypothetical protein